MVSRFSRRTPLRGALAATTAVAFTWVGLLGGLPQARADEGDGTQVKVALLPLVPILGGASDAVSAKVSKLLAAEVLKNDAFVPVALTALVGAAAVPVEGAAKGGAGLRDQVAPFESAGDRALAQGRGLAKRAERELAQLHFDRAAETFKEGIAALDSAFDRLESFKVLTDAHLQLAIAELRLGHRDLGEEALAAVVRLAPDLALKRGHYPAVFVRLFTQVHDRLAGAAKGSLVVTSVVPGEAIYLDGEAHGVTPLRIDGLIPGRHFVVVKGASGQVAYQFHVRDGATVQLGGGDAPRRLVTPAAPVAVGADDQRALDVEVKNALDEARANLLDGQGDLSLSRIAHATGAQFLLLGGLHALVGGDLAVDLLIYRAKGDQIASLPRHHFDTDLTGARVELFQLALEAAQKATAAELPGPLTLPAPIAPDYVGAPLAKVAKVVAAPIVMAKAPGDGEARVERPTGLDANPRGQVIEADAVDSSALGAPPPEATVAKSSSKTNATLAVVGLTVLAIGVLAVGSYFAYVAIYGKPVGGTPTVTW